MVSHPGRDHEQRRTAIVQLVEDLGLTDELQCEGHAEKRLATLSEASGRYLRSDDVPSPFPLAQCVALSNSSNDQLLLSISLMDG